MVELLLENLLPVPAGLQGASISGENRSPGGHHAGEPGLRGQAHSCLTVALRATRAQLLRGGHSPISQPTGLCRFQPKTTLSRCI